MTHRSIDDQITFLYTRDLGATARFYEELLGLDLVVDQGDCRVYRTSPQAYLGFCQRPSAPQEPSGVILTLVTAEVDAWYAFLGGRGVQFEKPPELNPRYDIYHCFLRDPNGYLVEIQRFNDPGWHGRAGEKRAVDARSQPGLAPVFADLALARRLEASDAWFKRLYAETQGKLRPDLDAAVEPVAGGYAVFAGHGSPLNRAVGLGIEGPVEAEEMERVERFFHSRGAPAVVDLCPLADPSLSAWLNTRGYRVAEFKNVWARPLHPDEVFPAPPEGMQVRAAGQAEAGLWIRTVSQGFAGRDGVTPENQAIATPNFAMAGTSCFLAWLGDEPVGGGAMAVHEALAAFFSASTRPAFRGRGVQTALLQARLAAAAAAGCDLAMVHTVPGTASQRNVERAGFRLAYTKLALLREPG